MSVFSRLIALASRPAQGHERVTGAGLPAYLRAPAQALASPILPEGDVHRTSHLDQLEPTVLAVFRACGYAVRPQPYVSEGVADHVLTLSGRIFLLACRNYDTPVRRPHVQMFRAAMVAVGAVEGYFVSASHFSTYASDYAMGRPLRLLDAETLTTERVMVFAKKWEW